MDLFVDVLELMSVELLLAGGLLAEFSHSLHCLNSSHVQLFVLEDVSCGLCASSAEQIWLLCLLVTLRLLKGHVQLRCLAKLNRFLRVIS